MRQLKSFMILAIILACVFTAAALSTAAETAVNRAYDHAERPPSAVDTVMRSRETAPEEPDNRGLMIVGFLAVAALIGGGVLLFLRFGGDFMRQGRLTLRAWQRPVSHSTPQIEQMASAPWEDAAQVPAVRRPQALPYHDDFYSD